MNLSVVIPALNAAATLPSVVASLDRRDEILVVDGRSVDGTATLAEGLGARVITAPRGRGSQLKAGAEAARGDWLLFLHADTRLGEGWREAALAHSRTPDKAAAYRFALDDPSPQARRLERWVARRVRLLALPYGDQGLLIHRRLYDSVGGFRPLPLMEDVDLVRRLGRQRLVALPVAAVTSATRWRREGWRRRSALNGACLTLYYLGAPLPLIARLYGR